MHKTQAKRLAYALAADVIRKAQEAGLATAQTATEDDARLLGGSLDEIVRSLLLRARRMESKPVSKGGTVMEPGEEEYERGGLHAKSCRDR